MATAKPFNISLGSLRDAHVRVTRKGGQSLFWKPEPGVTRVRFLPGWPNNKTSLPFVEILSHYVGGDENKYYNCPLTPGVVNAEGQPNTECLVCKAAKAYMRMATETEKQIGLDMRAKPIWLWNLLVRGKEAEGVKIYQAAKGVHEPVLLWGLDEEPDGLKGMFFDLAAGFDVKITRIGEKKMTKYTAQIVMQPCAVARTTDEIKKIWESCTDLTKYLTAPTNEELKKALIRMQGNPGELDFLLGRKHSTTAAATAEEEYTTLDEEYSAPAPLTERVEVETDEVEPVTYAAVSEEEELVAPPVAAVAPAVPVISTGKVPLNSLRSQMAAALAAKKA